MARKRCKLEFITDIFGTHINLVTDTESISICANQEINWKKRMKTVKQNFWWMRAPTCSIQDLQTTVQVLSQLEQDFEFHVWHNEGKWDASIKCTDEMDAAMVAWSLNGIWCKWDQAQEKEFLQSQKPIKPLKVKVNADGSIKIKGKVQVTQIEDTSN